MKWSMWLIAFTWELPQTLLALIVKLFIPKSGPFQSLGFGTDKMRSDVLVSFVPSGVWGVCLGRFILVWEFAAEQRAKGMILHEYGHSRQSLMFGPLYLFVVGLPSIIRVTLTWLGLMDVRRYYHGWPEKQADLLGGVPRK